MTSQYFFFFKCSILEYIQSEYFALYFLDEECKPMTLLSCDLYLCDWWT